MTLQSIGSMLCAVLCVALLSVTSVYADRIVFVHGYIGFGPDELLGVGYWGFPKIFGPAQDYINQMRRRGHQVLYASVGPISSNWDRACELYAQIMGTRVDYGAAHSKKNGHARFGKDYTGKGFFPQWSASKKVSFIAHSMGGNTVRMLEYLLQKGAPEEEAETGDATSMLFKKSKSGGNNWIHSIHTISSPHDGTPSSLMGQNFISFSKQTLLTYAAVAGISSLNVDFLYNFDLGQFGLDRNPGESFQSYFNRVFDSAALKDGFIDNASFDLSVDACWDFNNKTELTYPGTYYFSYAGVHTHRCVLSNAQCPDPDMEVFLAPTGLLMGLIDSKTCLPDRNYCFDRDEWAENDGVVPTRSSRGPQLGVRGYVPETPRPTKCTLWKCDYDNRNLQPSKWYTTTIRRDHTQLIGLRLNLLEPQASGGVYNDIADVMDAIKAPDASDYVPAFETDLPSSTTDPAVIAAPVSVGGVLLAGLAAVTIRRRRNRIAMAIETEKRASIVHFSSATAENPSFVDVNLKA